MVSKRKIDIVSYLIDKDVLYDRRSLNNDEVLFSCFFCGDKRGKFHLYVNPTKGVFNCFKCGHGGSVWAIPRYFHDDSSVLSSYESVRRKCVESTAEWEAKLPQSFKFINEYPAPDYLSKKRLDLSVIKEYKVGYCRFGPEAKRVIFPITHDDRLVGYTSKSNVVGMSPHVPKGFNIHEYLFGFDLAKYYDTCVVVEGPTDVMAVGLNAVGLCGKALSKVQMAHILNARFKRIIVCLDADAHVHTRKVARTLAPFVDTYAVYLDDGDPCDRIDDINALISKHAVPVR